MYNENYNELGRDFASIKGIQTFERHYNFVCNKKHKLIITGLKTKECECSSCTGYHVIVRDPTA
jgi:hypothetical protein